MTSAVGTFGDEGICDKFIWAHNRVGLAEAAPCDPNTWAGSVKSECDRLGPHPDLAIRHIPSPAYVGCAAIMMIKNEADIIHHNLTWLYYIGVRRFAIIDNDSGDRTWAELKRFRIEHGDAEILAVHDPIVRHLQGGKNSGLCHLARNVWPDVEWILPMDADEFLNARFGLRALLHVPDGVDALTIPKVVHFRPRGTADSEVPLISSMSLRCGPFIMPPKVILRARSDLNISQGNHWARTVSGRSVIYAGGMQFGFYHREFQTRSFAQFLSKVRQGGVAVLAARAAGFDPGGHHWLAWYEVLIAGGEDALRAEYEAVAFRDEGEYKGVYYVRDPFLWPG